MSLQAFEQGADIAFAIAEDDAIGDFFAVKSVLKAARFFIGATSTAFDTFLFVEEGGLPQCAWALAGTVPTGV